MPVLNSHNISIFFYYISLCCLCCWGGLLYAVEGCYMHNISLCCWGGGFNFQTTGIPILYVEWQCDRAFSESYTALSFVEVTNFACESLEFYRPLYVISNEVTNCLELVKSAEIWRCIANCYASFLNDVTRLIIFDNFERYKFWTRITTKRCNLVKQNLKGAHLNYWSNYQRLHFLQNYSKQSDHYFKT